MKVWLVVFKQGEIKLSKSWQQIVYIAGKMRDEIIYRFPAFNGAAV